MRRIGSFRHGAGGQPLAPLLFLLGLFCLPATARADNGVVADASELEGQTIQQLGALQDMAPMLRNVARGRQQVIFEHLRAPGSHVQAEDGFAWAWGCHGGDCAQNGLFLGHEPKNGLLWMLLIRDGELDRQVPPRGSPWPAPLVKGVASVSAELAARMARGG